jgi:DNA-binding NarL/FixJ family response regulator
VTRILIADDHPIFRRGLKSVLEAQPDVELVGEADSGNKVLEMARKRAWDIVVLDIAMPGTGGIEVLRTLKHERPKLPVLILSNHPEDQYAVRAVRAGAAGYITKEKPVQQLVQALQKVLHGGRYISESLAENLACYVEAGTPSALHETLSDREYQVMRMIASGKTLAEIASELHLSPHTVSTYRSRVFEKMQFNSDTELIRYTLENKLID